MQHSTVNTRCMTRNDPHGNSPVGVEHSEVNEFFVHTLYGPVQLKGGRSVTSLSSSVPYLGSPALPCWRGVRLVTTIMAMHNLAVKTLPSTKFSYTSAVWTCRPPWRWTQHVSHMQYTHPRQSRSALYTRCMDEHDPHSNVPFGIEHSAVNGIFIHTLYVPLQLHGGSPRTSHTGSLHIIGSPAAHCTLGVWLGTIILVMHHSTVNTLPSTNFRTPAVWTCTVKWRRTLYVLHRQCTHPRKSRSILYTRCMPRTVRHGKFCSRQNVYRRVVD